MADASESRVDILIRRPDGIVESLPSDRLGELDTLIAEPGVMACLHVTDPSDEVIGDLEREFGLHPLAVEDLRKQHQRPKIDTYAEQHMIVVYEAVEAAGPGDGLAEIHIFVGESWVLTVHWAPAPMIDAAHERLKSHPASVGNAPGEVLYALLDAAVDSFFPELDRLSDRIDALEDRVLETDDDRSALREILAIKRRLLDLRRVLAPMRDVANSLLRRETPLVDAAVSPYFQDLYDHLIRVLDQLDVYRDLLATVLDARLTVASNSLNAVMKRLTAFTVVLMIPTLIAGIYGMNFDFMPELRWAAGYPLALMAMVVSSGAAVAFFWRHGWF
ncbi:MAG: magnesium/cobalt transporter CorA [Candidatus Limnocylindria bacterium]